MSAAPISRLTYCAPDQLLPELKLAQQTIARLIDALQAIVKITDGSQPIDYPGALMVARAALARCEEVTA